MLLKLNIIFYRVNAFTEQIPRSDRDQMTSKIGNGCDHDMQRHPAKSLCSILQLKFVV